MHKFTRTLITTAFALIAFSAGLFAQSRARTEPLRIGDTAPDFVLTDQNGKQVTLSEAASPAVLVFYRGFW